MRAQYCHTRIRLTLTGSCPPLSHYSDTYSVLSAGAQSRLCHQYWEAGGCRGTKRGTFLLFFIFIFFLYLHVSCHLSWFDNAAWQRDVMISCCGQLFCHRMHHVCLRSDSFGYSTYCPQLTSLDVLFSNQTLSVEHAALCLASVCGWTFFFPLTVTESYRGLNSQRGKASSPSGQLQRCQQENQEAPASFIHPFLTHSGQRPLGGGEQEGGGAGEEGVHWGFPREGFVFSRSFWVWHWFLLPQQRREHQQQLYHLKRSWLCFTGGGVPLHLLPYLTFTPCLPCVTEQPCPHTILPAGGEGERGVRWAHIDWVYERKLIPSFGFTPFPPDRQSCCLGGGVGLTCSPHKHSALSKQDKLIHTQLLKLVKQDLFFSTLTIISLFHSKSQVSSCVFWTADKQTCSVLSVTNVQFSTWKFWM